MSEITDKSFLGGFSVLFGLLIYYDMNETDLVKNIIPQVETWYPEQWFSCTVIMLPLLILSFIRVLFSNA